MKISNDTYMKAYGLFCIAHEHQRKVDEFETAMNKLLNEDNGSHLSDLIYSYDSAANQASFDEALKKMGLSLDQP